MAERIQKILAQRGVASRRGAETLIADGRVRVNGRIARVGESAEASDRIEVDGKPIGASEHVYLVLNKPAGYVTSRRTTHGEQTVMDLVPPTAAGLNPVGRLDKDTSGLLFLTNDGDWANLVTHPRYEIDKEYLVVVRGSPDDTDLDRLRQGVVLRDGSRTSPAKIRRTRAEDETTQLSVTVIEGRKRQIRQMFAAIGHPVIRLERVRLGDIRGDGLAPGRVRPLRASEVEGIRERARKAARGSS